MRKKYVWQLQRQTIPLGDRTAIMGILNVTPDSFSDGGRYFGADRAVARGKEIEQEGADIIDVGGESTRPGGQTVPEDEELRRILPVIETLAGMVRIPISVDTYRSNVARQAMNHGAQIVNDISGFRFDSGMPEVVQQSGAGVVLMHSRGNRESLHKQARMQDVISEMVRSLTESADKARASGVSSKAIVIDPGIGFGKAAEESLLVLRKLGEFSRLNYPVLVGTSRKSFIRSLTSDAAESENWGTAATIAVAILNGAHIVRVHDVRRVRTLCDVTDQLL